MSIQKYKFGHIVNNKLIKTYVFSEALSDTLTDRDILYTKEGIYLDDKIDTIKKKLLIQLNKDGFTGWA